MRIGAHGFLWETWFYKIMGIKFFLWKYGNVILQVEEIFGKYFKIVFSKVDMDKYRSYLKGYKWHFLVTGGNMGYDSQGLNISNSTYQAILSQI